MGEERRVMKNRHRERPRLDDSTMGMFKHKNKRENKWTALKSKKPNGASINMFIPGCSHLEYNFVERAY